MVVVVLYLLAFLAALIYGVALACLNQLPLCLADHQLPFFCILAGGLGGVTYCLRSVYFHKAVKKDWDTDWYVWYVTRPILSLIIGFVAYLFLAAGLMFLDSEHKADSSNLGYFAFAYMAGLKVERFIEKIEEISKAAWGMKTSRLTEESSKDVPKKRKQKNA